LLYQIFFTTQSSFTTSYSRADAYEVLND